MARKIIDLFCDFDNTYCALADDGTTWWWDPKLKRWTALFPPLPQDRSPAADISADLLSALRSARARLALVFGPDRDPRDDATVREIDAAIERATS